jgi:hypothetical protein
MSFAAIIFDLLLLDFVPFLDKVKHWTDAEVTPCHPLSASLLILSSGVDIL